MSARQQPDVRAAAGAHAQHAGSNPRLRALLKLALRRFGLRCVAVEELAASAPNHQKEA